MGGGRSPGFASGTPVMHQSGSLASPQRQSLSRLGQHVHTRGERQGNFKSGRTCRIGVEVVAIVVPTSAAGAPGPGTSPRDDDRLDKSETILETPNMKVPGTVSWHKRSLGAVLLAADAGKDREESSPASLDSEVPEPVPAQADSDAWLGLWGVPC